MRVHSRWPAADGRGGPSDSEEADCAGEKVGAEVFRRLGNKGDFHLKMGKKWVWFNASEMLPQKR